MKTKIILLLTGFMLSSALLTAERFSEAYLNEKAAQSQSRYGDDSVSCVINISLYREFYRQWQASDFKNEMIHEIIRPWRWVINHCPLGSQNTYIDGVRIMQWRIENAKNDTERNLLIDTLMMVYDQRLEYFPDFHSSHPRGGSSQVGSVLGRKGVDLLTLAPERFVDVYNILKSSVELEGNRSDGTVLIYYFRSVIRMARAEKLENSAIIDTYDQIIDILDANIKGFIAAGDKQWEEIYKNVKANIEATFEPFATCEDLVRIYSAKFAQDNKDIELLKKATSMLDRRSCQDDPFYLTASVRLHEMEPSPESAFNIGRLMLREEKYNDAVPFLLESTKMEDTDRAQTAYKLLAEIYRLQKNYPRARQMALQAIALNPNDGNPYILIGDMYASSAKDCGSGDFYGKIAFWAAVDKYIRARQVDSSVAEMANGRIRGYEPFFPTAEAIFFHDFHVGDSFTVECWINETTTIRAARQ